MSIRRAFPGTLRRVVAALVLLVPLLAAGWARAREAEPTAAAPSTQRMAARLLERTRDFEVGDLAEQLYFSANAPWRIPRLREQAESAQDARERMDVRFALAQQLLWDGQSAAALAEFEKVQADAVALGSEAATRSEQALRPWLVSTHLRLGEQRNCLARHTPDACLFPFRGEGIHEDRSGVEAAAVLLRKSLSEAPGNTGARYLLNLVAMAAGTHPESVPEAWRIPAQAFDSATPFVRFPNVARAAGAALEGLAGGGVMEDLDGDGLLDLAASSWGLHDPIRILRNRGDRSFEDVTAAAGLTGITGGLNLTHADYDGDGRPDLLVVRGGWLGPRGRFPPSLLRNLGGGRFEDVTESAGLIDEHPGQTAVFADYDGDGDLDLFLGREWSDPADPHPSRLFRNEGDGTFRDVAPALGLDRLGWVKGAAWGDYDDDGRPDLYISRLGEDNLLFHNEGPDAAGGWRFRERGKDAGVSEPRLSFPTWFFDYDNDGHLDLFVAAWDGAGPGQVAAAMLGEPHGAETPRLYRNRGDGRFEDVTARAGVDRVLITMGANFGDLDNDGFEDIYLGTGAPALWALVPNRMLRNDAGRRFEDITTAGGFGHLQKGHGIAFGDFDADGDQDVYAVMGGWYSGDIGANALFLNPGNENAWITLRLVGTRSNRFGVGARIEVRVLDARGERRIHRSVGTGGSFGSSSLQQEIGLGPATSIVELVVRWPASGIVQRFRDVEPRRIYRVREDADRLEPVAAP